MELESAATPPYAVITGVQEVPAALDALGVRGHRPVLALVGGAGGMTDADRTRVASVLRAWLVPVLERHRAAVVDGGTDVGVMRMIGEARRDLGAGFPLIGVAALETVRLPGRIPAADAADLDPGHTGIVVVPGTDWGDESPWLGEVARNLAGDRSAVTLVVNGGPITLDDVENSLAAGRPVLVVRGTGRTADVIADALAAAAPPDDARLAAIVSSPLLGVVDLADPPRLAAAVEAALSPRAGSGSPSPAR